MLFPAREPNPAAGVCHLTVAKGSMMDAAEFRKRAQECLDVVPNFSSEQRALLISIAEAWIALAEAELAKEPWFPQGDADQSSGNTGKPN
jgi:hypothetical protein